MNKLKILKILNFITAATLITNVSVLARGKYESKIQETQKNEGQKVVQQQKDAVLEQETKNSQEQLIENSSEQNNEKKVQEIEIAVENKTKTAAETDDNLKSIDENKTEKKQILKGKKKNICNMDFIEVLEDNLKFKLDVCIYNGCIVFLITGIDKSPVKSKMAGKLQFWFTINSDIGHAHLLEHVLYNLVFENKEKGMKEGRIFTFYSDYDNDKATDFVNAYTIPIDTRNNYGAIEFPFNKELFKDPKNFKKFCDEFLGNPTFKRDGGKLFKRDIKNKYYGKICGRALLEMYGKYNHSNQEGTIQKIVKEANEKKSKLKYDIGGIYEKMTNVTFKDIEGFYEKYVNNGMPILFLYGDNYDEIKKPLTMLKENFLDKKKKGNIPKRGEDKFKGDYIKIPISQEMSKETGDFEFTTGEEGNKKIEKTKQKAVISKDVYDFNLLDKFILTCLKNDFFEKRIDLEKYGLKKVINRRGTDGFFLDIFSDEKNIFDEKNIKETLNSIKEDIIKDIEKKGIDFDKDINKEMLKNLKKITKKYDYSLNNIAKDMIRSYFLEKTPFSKKLFKFNKKGKLENNFDNFEEYIKKHCIDVLKKLLGEKIKLIQIFKEKEGNYDIKKDFEFNNNTTYLPYEFPLKNPKNPVEEIPEIMLSEEILENYILAPFIVDEGLIYKSFKQSGFLNLFILDLCDLEEQNIKNFFDKDFKKHLDELNKKLKNKSLDKILDLKINSFKDIIKIVKNNLEKSIKPFKDHINDIKGLLNKKEIYLKDLEKIRKKDKSTMQPFCEAEKLLKYPVEEYEKILKERNEARQHILKLQKWEENAIKKLKDNAKKYDKQTTKEYQEILKETIKKLENDLKLQLDGLKKLETIEKIFNKKDSLEKIREGAKEKISKLIIHNFDKFNKDQKNRFKTKEAKKNKKDKIKTKDKKM